MVEKKEEESRELLIGPTSKNPPVFSSVENVVKFGDSLIVLLMLHEIAKSGEN